MRRAFFSLSALVLTVLPAAADELPSARPVPPAEALPLPHRELSLRWRDREVVHYVAGADGERPYWHPLQHASGRSLVRLGHPHDPRGHSHHNGVWISHVDVNGINFWEDKVDAQHGRIVQRSVDAVWDGARQCGAAVTNVWQTCEVPGAPAKPLLEEKRTFYWQGAAGGDPAAAWWLVVEVELTPVDGDVTFGDTAFGLIGVRMAKSIGVRDGGGRILNSEGQVNEPAAFRKPARWVDYSGPVTDDERGGICLMLLPEKEGTAAPDATAFHVRDDGWMGACLSFGRPVTATRSQPLRRRWALFGHSGVPTREELATRHAEALALRATRTK